jgi:type VI secretion system protein ImpB
MNISRSGQAFIGRNRKPRVHIVYQDPYKAELKVELPFVMAVLSDLSGNASSVEKRVLNERKLVEIHEENFEERMAAIAPALTCRVNNVLSEEEGEQLAIRLDFKTMNDFTPVAIAKQVPALKALLERRNQLQYLMARIDGKQSLEKQLEDLLANPALMSAVKDRYDTTKALGEESAATDEPVSA